MQEVHGRGKVRRGGFQIADEPKHDGVEFDDFLQPEVVDPPRTAFNGDCADDVVRLSERLVPSWQGRFIQDRVGLVWPRHSTRPRGIKKVYVRVDNWNGIVQSVKERGRYGTGGKRNGGFQNVSSFHFDSRGRL
jgi:hypothetical protein